MSTNQSTSWQGQTLSHYHLIRLLGKESGSETWIADDNRSSRQVIVRLLPPVHGSEREYLQAFGNQAQAMTMLKHPNILPVFDYGEQRIPPYDVVTYLIMPYITGGSLSDRTYNNANNPLPTEECLRYLKQIAQALDYAHNKQMIHGNLKPSNILLQHGEVLLADFGISMMLTSTAYRNRTYTVGVGSAEYMAPEQAQGRIELASDRYSLAILAYQLLTGFLPFSGTTPYGVMLKHMRERPPSPRQLASIPEQVEDILMQGLAKRPEDRPPSCVAFVEALTQAWQTQVLQSPKIGQEDADKTILTPWSIPQGKEHLLITQIPFPPVESPFNGSAAVPQPPMVPSSAGTPPSLQPINGSPASTLEQYLPAAQAQYLSATPPTPTVPEKIQQTRKIGRRAMLIGGTAAAGAIIVGSVGLTILMHSSSKPSMATTVPSTPGPHKLQAGVPTLSLTGHTAAVWTAVWDPTGRYLATGGEDHSVMVWDIGGHLRQVSGSLQALSQPLRRWKLDDTIFNNHLAWSTDGHKLIVSTDNSKLYLLEAFGKQGTPIAYFDEGKINDNFDPPSYGSVAWDPTKNLFASSVSQTETAALWQPEQTTTPFKTLTYVNPQPPSGGIGEITELVWSPDGSKLAGLTNYGRIIIWQPTTGKLLKTFDTPDRGNGQPVFIERSAIAWSPRDPNLIMVSDIDIAMVWDIRKTNNPLLMLGINDPFPLTPPPQQELNGIQWTPHTNGLTWAPNGRYIAGSYGRSASVYVWETAAISSSPIQRGLRMQKMLFGDHGGHNKAIIDVAWSPDGRYIATASADTTVIIWQVSE